MQDVKNIYLLFSLRKLLEDALDRNEVNKKKKEVLRFVKQ